MLMDKINELEREKHKLLSQLTSSMRDSSPSSIDSCPKVTSAATISTSSAPCNASIQTLFATSSSLNQIKQERLVSLTANNPQSDCTASTGANHGHSFDVSNGSMIDQTSVIVSVTSSCPLSGTAQNCIPREQAQSVTVDRHSFSPSRLNDDNRMNCDDDDDKSPSSIRHTSDDNCSPSHRQCGASEAHDAPADCNNQGLVNLKISSASHLHNSNSNSSKSSTSPASVVIVTVGGDFAPPSPAKSQFVDEHVNY